MPIHLGFAAVGMSAYGFLVPVARILGLGRHVPVPSNSSKP
jgi:hypothetical protein